MQQKNDSGSFHLVSICIPAYNEPELFKRCIDSIITQDYPCIEIVVSDDSSTLDVKEVLASVSTTFPIKYCSNSPALKSPKNWNHAIDMADGDLIMLMHHDDFFIFSSSVSSFVDTFKKHPEHDLIFSSPYVTYEGGKTIQYSYREKEFRDRIENPYRLFLANILGAPSNLMFRKNNIRYNEQLVWMVDMEYYFRCINAKMNAGCIQEPLVSTGVHPNQTTNFCNAHPDIALREHVLVAKEISRNTFNDVLFYDHYWRQLRNNRIRNVNDPVLGGLTLPAPILHMLNYLRILPGRWSFVGLLSKAMMIMSYLAWRIKMLGRS